MTQSLSALQEGYLTWLVFGGDPGAICTHLTLKEGCRPKTKSHSEMYPHPGITAKIAQAKQ